MCNGVLSDGMLITL